MEITRELGRSGIEISALGFGCWAVGGEWQDTGGQPLGWGKVDDEESVRAIRRALDLGVTFFDTADTYGAGHSERVLGRALGKRRADVVVATKWGNVFDEDTRTLTGTDDSPEYARRALTASLRRLGTDHVDLYQLHLSDADPERAAELRETCEEFVREGLIRAYGWSTDDPARAAVFAEGAHCAAVQHRLNVLQDAPEMLALCAESGLAGINRSPLAMGLLTGKRAAGQPLEAGDIRSAPPAWLPGFATGGGADPEWTRQVDALRQVLTSDGRTLAQGSLAWIWARAGHTVPIPGFRTVVQAEENAGALAKGPLPRRNWPRSTRSWGGEHRARRHPRPACAESMTPFRRQPSHGRPVRTSRSRARSPLRSPWNGCRTPLRSGLWEPDAPTVKSLCEVPVEEIRAYGPDRPQWWGWSNSACKG